jgi:hypothetical protein
MRTTLPEHTRPPMIREYGCCKCQTMHSEGDRLYADHLFHQWKHGVRWCQATPAEHLRILLAG